MGEQQLDGLRLAGIVGIADEPPEPALAQRRTVIVAVSGQPPGPGFPVQVVRAVMGHHDLLAEPVVAVRSAALTLTAPHAHQRQQSEQPVIEVRALPQIGGVGGHGQVTESRDVARGGLPGTLGCCGDRVVARGHDSSVISRYSAYNANHVITTTAATSRSS